MIEADNQIDRVVSLMRGFRATQTVYVVAKLGLADRLSGSPATAQEVAADVDAHPDSLQRVMRLAAFYGLFEEIEGGRFALTSLGRALTSSSPDSVKPLAVMVGEAQYEAWGALLHSVRTGTPAFEHVHGAGFFEYLAAHPEAQEVFDAAMSVGVNVRTSRLPDVVDFSASRLLVDVGGGNGSLAAAVLKRHPHLRAVIYDQPQVLEAADKYLSAIGVRERCELVSGSFFESVPPGGDVYLLSNIVHDWDDERALRILRNCRAAMKPEGAVLLVETVLGEHGRPSAATLADVNMLVLLTGRERTENEFRALLERADFRLTAVNELSWDHECALEARPLTR
ncbi:MAG TPA: methyltransferase [Candidatus Limnocylindria bacterium]|nr:methyltransferase [Candidatus Limnocylindria bacterium]